MVLTNIYGIVLVLHGLVHLLYVGQSLRKFELAAGMVWPIDSWLFKNRVDGATTQIWIAVSLAIAALGFAAAGFGSLLHWSWWQLAAVASAAFSILIFITAWDGRFKGLSDQGGFGMLIDLAVIVLLVLTRWLL